ncbi:MAG: riboflavin synthase [Planctomycetales bacterium]|nr:riboflavin synthase [Planctomycetales bacterium]
MFTGLVELMGQVAAVHDEPPGVRVQIECPTIAPEVAIGDSICVNGCCLTVIGFLEASGGRVGLDFQAGEETLSRTNLGELAVGSPVNLERSLRPTDRLGGHYVTGHIDGMGKVVRRTDSGDWSELWFEAPSGLMRQMASKGSIAVDGVSLTLVEVTDHQFSVALIPHTLDVTTLGRRAIGNSVNLETDVLAKYVQRQLEAWTPPESA